MDHLIIIDEPALKECVESNLYQSRHFEAGEALAKALDGGRDVSNISPRIVPTWRKNNLYLLQSRIETGFLVIDASVFDALPQPDNKNGHLDDVLLVFQRICRFSVKEWLGMSFSQSEIWSIKTGCGVVFPFPKSKHTDYRVSIKKEKLTERQSARHGNRQLFAFAAGGKNVSTASPAQEREYKRALEELTPVRASVDVAIRRAQTNPVDTGYHPLILSNPNHEHIKYQSYDQWVGRLTIQQKAFVESFSEAPQRVEGPAGTGKTLCLLLRAYCLCKRAESLGVEIRILFVSHSEATKKATETILGSFGPPNYAISTRKTSLQTIEFYTLQEWCGQILGTKEITSAQYLDEDALQAKEMRKLIVKDVLNKRLRDDPKSVTYLSQNFKDFFTNESREYLAELLQHEIGVMIKGRASENLETYIDLPPLTYCMPTRTANDRRFIYSLYTEYQKDLYIQNVYDTDDIVLSALGRLNTPIWRRRRAVEGYDVVMIDETHLFNFNELAVFHHLVRAPDKPRILFSIDRSQAPGERGITGRLIREVLTQSASNEELETRIQVVFRCAPNVVRLAEAITCAAATLFTTFENPLLSATSVITASDEALACEAKYWKCSNDEVMCAFVTKRAKEISNRLKCPVNDVLVVATHDSLLPKLCEEFANRDNRFVQLVRRGDAESVKNAAQANAFVISHPDYVGGLEFKAVLIVGVDEGRVPPSEGALREESRHFVEFKACNRMYVAVSRARLCVELFYSAERGKSSLLNHALATFAIVEKDCSSV